MRGSVYSDGVLFDRVQEFLGARQNSPEVPDSLPELMRLRSALSRMYAELARDPGSAPEASALLAEMTAEYERLLRQVGAETLARTLAAAEAEEPEIESAEKPAPPVPGGEPVNETPASEPVSEQDVRAWAERYRSGSRPSGVHVARTSPALVLYGLLDRLGPPPDGLDARSDGERESELLENAVSEEALSALRQLPNNTQREYLRLVTARLNSVREAADGDVLTRERVRRLLNIIRDYTREYRPGAVHGLASAHEPKAGSWQADALHLWRRLVGDGAEAPTSRRAPKTRARRGNDDEEPNDADEATAHIPAADWALWSVVRGRTVLMIGGSPRESARERIERTFAMRTLEWTADDPRKAQSAEMRIGAGGYHLVLVLLRFVSHATNEKLAHACAIRGVAYVPVEHGYGVASIQRSLERFMQPSSGLDEMQGSRVASGKTRS